MIDFQNISKQFGTQIVLDGASFRVDPGERVGVVGPNGAGKSTLFNLLIGELTPDAGTISLPRNLRLGYVHQELHAFAVAVSVLEYTENAVPALQAQQHEIIALEHQLAQFAGGERERALRRLGELQTDFEHQGGYDLRHRAEATLCGLGFDPVLLTEPFSTFSGGWQMRAELARSLISKPDVLVLDEPTNFLDVPAVEWLRDFLRSFQGTLLLISHDRYLLNSLTDVTLEVAGTKVTRYPGNYDEYIQARRLRYEHLLAAKKNQDQRREQLERFIERFRAKNSKAAQAHSKMKMLERMEEIVLPADYIKPPRIRLARPPHCGLEVVRLEDAGLSYDGQRWIMRHQELRLERGEKAAVVGLNGMGKTTLLRLLSGQLTPAEGRCVWGHQVQVGYHAQDYTETMDPARTVFATARAAAPDVPEKELRAVLGSFRFPGDAIEKPVAVLSGGEKARLALCRLLLNPPNFLILDEPTTHLDIASREALEQALQDYEGTICLVSHDIQFVRKVATTVFEVNRQGITRYYGDYDYYRAKLAADQLAADGRAAAEGRAEAPTRSEQRKQQKREEAERRQEYSQVRKPWEKQLTEAEALVDRLSAEQKEIVGKLGATDPGLDYGALSRRLGEIQAQLGAETARWEAAAEALEALRRDYE